MRIIIVVITFLAATVTAECDGPDGYILNKAHGKAYKLVYQAKTWRRAKVECENEGAILAVPKSEDEFQFIQKLVRSMYYPNVVGAKYKLLVWLGISNLQDYRVWKTVEDENLTELGFNRWATSGNGVSYSNDPNEPHCAGVDAANPGLRDYWCDMRQPFMCQLNETQFTKAEPPNTTKKEKLYLDLDLDQNRRIVIV